jgi:hypothetical protein
LRIEKSIRNLLQLQTKFWERKFVSMMLSNFELYGVRQHLSLHITPFVDIPRMVNEPILKLVEITFPFEEFSNLSANVGCVNHAG